MEKLIYKGIIFNNPDYDERNLNRGKTMTAIKKGIIKRESCEICHDPLYGSDAHHEKYSDYLNVRWLCRPHHKTIHSIFRMIKDKETEILYYEERIKKSEPELSELFQCWINDMKEWLSEYEVKNQ
jgi:hypothetical protein